MTHRTTACLITTGFWLGLSQVALGFHLLYSQGATIIYYFLLLNIWLAGSIVGLTAESKITSHFRLLHAACPFTFALTALSTRFDAFSLASGSSVLICAFLTGMFAGWFLTNQIRTTQQVSPVLLHENNGFIMGYAIAGVLLFFSVSTLDVIAILASLGSMILLLPTPVSQTE